ncbi:hypothetical protein H8D64_01470 [PVC group bacterium]|nr:hypothetical protein [PVC group bacterium]
MKKLISVVVLTVFVGTHAIGAMVGKGTREFDIGGMFDETDELNIRLDVSGGYYVMDYVEVGAGLGFDWLHDGDDLTIRGGFFGQYDLIHRPVELMPFVGGGLGIVHTDVRTVNNNNSANRSNSATAAELTGFGGLKYYLLDNLAISTQLDIMVATDDVYVGSSNKMEAFDWDISLSARFFF